MAGLTTSEWIRGLLQAEMARVLHIDVRALDDDKLHLLAQTLAPQDAERGPVSKADYKAEAKQRKEALAYQEAQKAERAEVQRVIDAQKAELRAMLAKLEQL